MHGKGQVDVTVVIPVYYNEGSLRPTVEKTSAVLERCLSVRKYEIIFVDDGSGDRSLDEALELRREHPGRVIVIELTRNFGQVAALEAGSRAAEGDLIVNMSADLQDPPSLIEKLIEAHTEEGYDIAVGTRATREETLCRRVTSRAFYYLMRKLCFSNIPRGGFDFILFTCRVRDEILSHYEANPFWQGKLLWSGYSAKFIPYHRRDRELGVSRWTFGKKVKYLLDGLMAYSYFPLRAMSMLGILTFLAGILYALTIVVTYAFGNVPFKGWAPIMIILLLASGLQMLMLGILGEYLWRTLDQVRQRPRYVIRRMHGREPLHQAAGGEGHAARESGRRRAGE